MDPQELELEEAGVLETAEVVSSTMSQSSPSVSLSPSPFFKVSLYGSGVSAWVQSSLSPQLPSFPQVAGVPALNSQPAFTKYLSDAGLWRLRSEAAGRIQVLTGFQQH